MMENVRGFEKSEAKKLLIKTLESSGYFCQEFLLSPLQLGIPNSRLRYYLLASRSSNFNFHTQNAIHTTVPRLIDETNGGCVFGGDCSLSEPLYDQCQDMCRPLSDFLEAESEETMRCLVPEKLLKRFWVMDVVSADDTHCCCFTKRYGHHIEGAGSVLRTGASEHLHKMVRLSLTVPSLLHNLQNELKTERRTTEQLLVEVQQLKLRFFTPMEIARLMCFPDSYCE